mgnify:CR=1 FL=1
MLVENKFIFISLPRCASTAFHISCFKHGFELDFNNPRMIKFNNYMKLNPDKFLNLSIYSETLSICSLFSSILLKIFSIFNPNLRIVLFESLIF